MLKQSSSPKIGNKFYYVGILRCCLNYFGISNIFFSSLSQLYKELVKENNNNSIHNM